MPENTPIVVSFLGDLMLGGDFLARASRRRWDLLRPFEPVRTQLADTDLLVANLEGPIIGGAVARPTVGVPLASHPAVLGFLRSFPACVCNLANEHIMDYGREGMEETLSLLEGDGIRHVGAGMNHADADRMTSVECRGRRFAFLGFASQAVHMNLVTAGRNRAGCAPIPSADRLAARIGQLRGQADAVVLSLHHGQEYFRFPSPAQVDLARTAARAGANVVLGHHPHALQGLEHSAGSVIAHSIGNFFLPSVRSVGGRRLARRLDREYVILKVRFFGRGDLQVQVLGGRLRRDGRLVPCDDREQHSLHWRIQRLSDPLRLDDYALFWQQYRVRRRRILAAWSLLDALIRAVESPLAAGRGG